MLDCATGSGAVALALASELPDARVWASDRSTAALAVARVNGARHAPRVRFVAGDLLACFRDEVVDLLVSNPPYLRDDEIAGVEPEVREFEPRQALAAGPDGLDALRALVADGAAGAAAWRLAARSKWALDRPKTVVGFLELSGRYTDSLVERDYAGIPRVVGARRRRDGTWTVS